MQPPEYYRDREQTYLKHFFLERYLERVAYNIGSFSTDFVYVDGFSGPWQAEGQALEDTSFMIAIQKLRSVRDGLFERLGKRVGIRCLFIEKDPVAFATLQKAVQGIADIKIRVEQGEFEKLVPEVLRFIGGSFSLTFIDPTGWSGFELVKITPVLQHPRGEVLLNFMYDHINRFLNDAREATAESFTKLFGGPIDESIIRGADRERKILTLYLERFRQAGKFAHVTSTRILHPVKDRTYFHLVYGTRHPKGVLEFRSVEKKAFAEQERIRVDAKQTRRIERSGQEEFFKDVEAVEGPRDFDQERRVQLRNAEAKLLEMLTERGRIRYEDVRVTLLEMPLVWESDVKEIILHLRGTALEIEGMKGKQRKPQEGHFIVGIPGKSPSSG